MAAVLIPAEDRDLDRTSAAWMPRPALRFVPGGPGQPSDRGYPSAAADRPAVGRVRPRRPSAPVYRRRRTVAAGLLAGVGIAVWLVIHAVVGAPAPTLGRSSDVAAHVYTVQPGDTLWSIAEQLQPNSDIRPLVDALNAEVHGQAIQPGEQLQVP